MKKGENKMMRKRNKFIGILLSLFMVVMLVPVVTQAATLTTVTVKKTDVDGNPLAGAVFQLTGTGNSINQNYNAASDENGIAEFLDVADGTYELTEAMAPDGYAISSEVYQISVYDGIAHLPAEDTTTSEDRPYEMITFVNEKLPTYSFDVKKVDNAGNPLTGAVFTLNGTGNYIGHNYEAVSGTNGIATFDVREGFYTLAEKTAPDGYIKSDKTYEICIFDGRVFFVEEAERETIYTDYETVTYINEKENVPSEEPSGPNTTNTQEPAKTPNTPKAPKTGDNSHMMFWFTLALASGVVGMAVYRRKKEYGR